MITAAKTLCSYHGSKIAQENLEVFIDMYQWLVSDMTSVVKDVLEASQSRPEKQVYMSLPRPGVSYLFVDISFLRNHKHYLKLLYIKAIIVQHIFW